VVGNTHYACLHKVEFSHGVMVRMDSSVMEIQRIIKCQKRLNTSNDRG
jgi:hypothetical protein